MSYQVGQQSNSNNIKPALSLGGGKVFQPLVEIAVPDLYRKNAFRILGLPTNSEPREIRKQLEKAKLMSKYGAPSKADGPLPIGDIPDPDAIHELLHELKDPERRLLQEFFWFWPLSTESSSDDSALAALKDGGVSTAIRIWAEASDGFDGKDAGKHNLAILHHAMALDCEGLVERVVVSEEAIKDCESMWNQAFEYWESVLDGEGAWSALSNRIRELDDQRLTTGAARRIRATLPLALLSINAELAVRAATDGRCEDCARQLRVMRHSGLDEASMDEALRNAAMPISKRVQALCKKSTEDAEADHDNADKTTRWLVEQSQPLLMILTLVLGRGNPTHDNACDKVALAGLSCAIDYANRTESWSKALELLELIEPLPVGTSARSRIKSNLDIIRGNAGGSQCWFCGVGAGIDTHSFEVKMFGDVRKSPTYNGVRITWNKVTVNVARCESCAEAHAQHRNRISLVGAGLGLVSGSVGIVVWNMVSWAGVSLDALSGGLLWGGAASLGGAVIGLFRSEYDSPGEIKSISEKLEHPRIKELQERGWEFGEEPATEA